MARGSWMVDAAEERSKGQIRNDLYLNGNRMPLKDVMHGSDKIIFAF